MEEEALELLGEIADGCKGMSKALKENGKKSSAPVIHNQVNVPKSEPVIHNEIKLPPQAAPAPPVVQFLPQAWEGIIKPHRDARGFITHYSCKPMKVEL